MSQLYMIDTNTVSYLIKGNSPAARERLASLHEGEVACISVITEAELRYGLAKIPRSGAFTAGMEGFLARIQILPWGTQEADVYGSLRANQEKTGKPLGNLDMLIAAHAVAVRAILVTKDKAFSQVPELSATENWATDLWCEWAWE